MFNISNSSYLPMNPVGGTLIYFVQIFIFGLIVIINIDIGSLSRFHIQRYNFFLWIVFLIAFLFLISVYVNFNSNVDAKSFTKLISYPILFFLFFFIFPKALFNKDALFEKFLNFWIIFSLFASVIGFLFYFLDIHFNPNFNDNNAMIAFFIHPNTFSFVFTFAVPMVIYKFFTKQISMGLFVVLIIILLLCLLFTFSRAGYMGTFASILILTYKRSKYFFITALIILTILGATLFLSFATGKTDSSISRLQVMYIGYDMIVNNGLGKFLWGYGVTNHAVVFKNNLAVFGNRDELDPHNLLLLLGIQYGVLFTSAFIFGIIFLLVKSFLLKSKKMSFEFNQKIGLAIAIVVGILVQDILEDIIAYPEFFEMPMFLIFLGYLYYSIYQNKNKLLKSDA